MPIPWKQLILLTPQIVDLSRDLLGRVRGKPATAAPIRATDGSDVGGRIAALEENERRQAELVERMATQQADLSRAVLDLHRRQRWLIGAIVVLLAVLVWHIAAT